MLKFEKLNSKLRRIAAVFLSVSAIFVMHPFASVAASQSTQSTDGFDIWVVGVKVTADNKDDIPLAPYGTGKASYDPGTKTLTLSNVAIEWNANRSKQPILIKEDGVTIRLVGKNKIEEKAVNVRFSIYTIKASGSLTFTGDGSLEILSGTSSKYDMYSIKCDGDVTFSGCTVSATVGNSTSTRGLYNNQAIYSGGKISFIGGKVTAISGSAAQLSSAIITAVDDISIDGTEVIAKSGKATDSYAIYTNQNIEIKNASVTAAGGESTGSSIGIISGENKKLTVEKSTVNASAGIGNCSLPIWSSDMTFDGGSITALGGVATSESYGISAAKFEMKDGTVLAEGGDATDWSIGLWTNDATIYGGCLTAIAGSSSGTNAITSAPAFADEYKSTVKAGTNANDAVKISSPTEETYQNNTYILIEPYTHTHSWSEAWTSDATHHWHVCTGQDCDITDASQKDAYSAHAFDLRVTDDAYKASDATYMEKAKYFYSCVCGAKGDQTFEDGDVIADTVKPSGDILVGGNSIRRSVDECEFELFMRDSATVTIVASDAESGIASVKYRLFSSIPSKSDIEAATGWFDYTEPLTLNPGDAYAICVKITDNQNNETYLISCGITIDNVAPVASGIESGKTYCKGAEFTVIEDFLDEVTVNGRAINPENGKYKLAEAGETTIAISDKAGNVTVLTVTVNASHTPEPDDGNCTTPVHCSVCGTVTKPAQIHDFTGTPICEPGGHRLKCRHDGCGVAGGLSSHVWKVGIPSSEPTYFADGARTDSCVCGATTLVVLPKLVDDSAPTAEISIGVNKWSSLANKLTFGLFFGETQNVTVKASDIGSGVDKIMYFLAKNEIPDIENVTWSEFPGTLRIDSDGKYIVYVKVTDKVGNYTVVSSAGLVLDAVLPQIDVTDGKTYCKARTITVRDDNTDTVKLNGKVISLENGKFTVSPGKGIQTIEVTDKAGNKVTASITVNSDHVTDSGKITTAPTAAKEGVITFRCKHCGALIGTESAPKLSPAIIDGEGGIYIPRSNSGLTFRSDAALTDLLSVSVDKIILEADKYDASEGSTIITLKPEFLDTLSPGKHTVEIISVSGTASAEFTIGSESTDKTTPDDTQTPTSSDTNGGTDTERNTDSRNIIIPTVLTVVCAIAIFSAIIIINRKKR